MDARRKRFTVALAVFALWVVSLAALAAYSGRRPVARGAAPAAAPR